MKKSICLVLSLVIVMVFAATACSPTEPTAPAEEPAVNEVPADEEPTAEEPSEEPIEKNVKVAVVLGTLGDNGFNDQAFKGLQTAAEDFSIEFDYAECPDLADVESYLRSYADTEEYDLIVDVGSNHGDVLAMVAPDYPDQKFSLVDTIIEGFDNVHSTAAIDAEQGFLSGVISGIVTLGEFSDTFTKANTNNVIVYAGGADSPTSRAGAAGYMAGVKYVNPECEILYTIVGSYNDPVRAKEIALTGVARGADIITGNCGAGSMGLIEAAKESDRYVITTSIGNTDPDYSLCTSIKLTENQVYDEIAAIVNGTWTAGGARQGIVAGYCDYSVDYVNIEYPQELLDIVETVRQNMIDGKITLPTDVDQLDAWAAENHLDWKN